MSHVLTLVFSLVGFLLILSVLVIIHELGHFITARKFGIKVEEFGFGLPPRALKKIRKGTIYSLNWLPLGGFVKLYGEDPAGGGSVSKENPKITKDLDKAFFARPAWQRATVIVAGVAMNALLAFLIYGVFLVFSGFKTDLPQILPNHKFFLVNTVQNNSVYIGSVSKNSPAESAGITPYSKVVSVNEVAVKDSTKFVAEINKDKGESVTLVWLDKNNKTHTAQVTPRIDPPKGQGPLGISLASVSGLTLSYDTPAQKILSPVVHPLNLLSYTLDGTKSLIAQSIHQKSVKTLGENLSGPVGIFVVVGDVVSQSGSAKELFLQALNLAGLISISLAFFNILPIPALDGGRLLFIIIEIVTRKKVSPRAEAIVNSAGFVVLIGLVISVTVFFDLPKLADYLRNLFNG
jgi:regulator of sigma E protease